MCVEGGKGRWGGGSVEGGVVANVVAGVCVCVGGGGVRGRERNGRKPQYDSRKAET